jgi:HNH endonuclease
MDRDYRGLTKDLPVIDEGTFLSHITIVGECWEWQGARNVDGYGLANLLRVDEKLTHRIVYHVWWGPIRYGLLVRHRCDNPPCSNPDHLELGTASDNAQDRELRGRGRWRAHRG